MEELWLSSILKWREDFFLMHAYERCLIPSPLHLVLLYLSLVLSFPEYKRRQRENKASDHQFE
jgi:hypothetical protein